MMTLRALYTDGMLQMSPENSISNPFSKMRINETMIVAEESPVKNGVGFPISNLALFHF